LLGKKISKKVINVSIAMGAIQLSLLIGSLGVLAYSFIALLRGNKDAEAQ